MERVGLHRIVIDNAKKVARRYKRKCWWVDETDLRQEAICQQLRAYAKFDPQNGTPLEGYLWKVAVYAARRALLKSSAPVSAQHRVEVLKGIYRAPVDDQTILERAPDASQTFFARQVQDRLVRCLGEDRAQFAWAIFVEGWGTKEVAKANGVTNKQVKRELACLQGLLSADPMLHQLWRDG